MFEQSMPPKTPPRAKLPFTMLILARALACLIAALITLGCGASQVHPGEASRQNDFGVLVMAHGGPADWNAAVIDAVAPLRDERPVEVAFGMADATTIQEAARKLEARGVRRIGVVRLFVSGASWYERTEQILGIAPMPADALSSASAHHSHHAHGSSAAATAAAPPPNTPDAAKEATAAGDPHAGHTGHHMAFFRIETHASYALSKDGLADAETMGTILAERALALSRDPAKEDVLVLAHGPESDDENAQWLAKLDARAAAIRARFPFRRVQVETLREDWPEKRLHAERRIRAFVERAANEGGKAIVIPFRVQGFGPYATVLEGLQYASDGKGLIPHAAVTEWIRRQASVLETAAFRAPIQG